MPLWLADLLPDDLFSVRAFLAWGQTKPATVPPATTPAAAADDDDDRPVPPPPSAAAVPADAPVLTVKGLCPADSAKSGEASAGGCQTVITRAEFEKIARSIQPSLSPCDQAPVDELVSAAADHDARGGSARSGQRRKFSADVGLRAHADINSAAYAPRATGGGEGS